MPGRSRTRGETSSASRRKARPGRVVGWGLGVLLGLLLCEAFLQLALGRTREMGFWFTPGVHEPDARFGFVFTPGYRGLMRHPDRLFAEALVLDERGFRLPVGHGPEPRAQLVFIGGASMMFSYGLTDAESIPGQVALASRHPLEALGAAWPGQSLHASWITWRELSAGAPAPDLVVVALFYVYEPPLRVSAAQAPPGASESERARLFRHTPGLVLTPRGPVTEGLGRIAFRSLLVHEAARFLDETLPRRVPAPAVAAAGLAEAPEPKGHDDTVPLQTFLRGVADVLRSEGSELLVVTLPRGRAPADYYEALLGQVPDDVAREDVHRTLLEAGIPVRTFAAGHYAAETAGRIGRAIAEAADPILDARSGRSAASREAP